VNLRLLLWINSETLNRLGPLVWLTFDRKHFRKLVQHTHSSPEYQSGHFNASSAPLALVMFNVLSLMKYEK
jgi:hypothetical protein